MRYFKPLAALTAVVLIASGSFALAQDADRPDRRGGVDRPDRGERGERGQRRGGWDREQMRDRMTQAMKQRLDVSDEEWEAIGPRIEAVMRAQRDANVGRMSMMGNRRGGPERGGPERGGRGGRGNAGEGREPSPVAEAARALRESLQDEATAADVLAERLDAFREARDEARDDLGEARGELKELLTQRQEAMLVVMGILE
jgi:hypothetical protein